MGLGIRKEKEKKRNGSGILPKGFPTDHFNISLEILRYLSPISLSSTPQCCLCMHGFRMITKTCSSILFGAICC